MIALTDQQIEQVAEHIEAHGVQLYDLKMNLLDHVCCAIEDRLNTGISFQNAFEEAFSAFGEHGLLRIQIETEELLNQKENTMRQSSFISGIIAGGLICLGSLFKFQHWPGAGVLLLLGMFCLALAFIPSLFIYYYKNEFSKSGKIAQIVGLIAINLGVMSVMFKIFHWPGAWVMFMTGMGIAVFVYLPLLIYKNSLEKSTVSQNKFVIVTFLLSIGGFSFFGLRAKSSINEETYLKTNAEIHASIAEISKKIETLKSNHENDSVIVLQKKLIDELQKDLDQLDAQFNHQIDVHNQIVKK